MMGLFLHKIDFLVHNKPILYLEVGDHRMNDNKIRLTASEIGALWTAYMNGSLAHRMISFMLKDIEDVEIKTVTQQAYDLSSKHLQALEDIFDRDQFARPEGFTEQDVNMNAPWLFSDTFCLTYIAHMARVSMIAYSGYVAFSYREDICNYFSIGLGDVNKLYNLALKVALKKGLNARHPYIEVPKEVDYVDSKKYMSGLNPLNEKRPLNAVEISHLYMNIMTNSIGFKLCIAFAQTSPSDEVQDFMLKGKDLSQKHIKIFNNILLKDDIESPHIPDVGVSDSTTQTFSDKLMMFHMSLLTSAGIGNYATGAAASQRSDLILQYERLSLEVSRIAKSGADIMIKNNYLEQLPGTKNREQLAKKKAED